MDNKFIPLHRYLIWDRDIDFLKPSEYTEVLCLEISPLGNTKIKYLQSQHTSWLDKERILKIKIIEDLGYYEDKPVQVVNAPYHIHYPAYLVPQPNWGTSPTTEPLDNPTKVTCHESK